jgi:hypothetical protein
LIEPERHSLIADAQYIAGGRLEFWGRTFQVELGELDWLADPLTGARLPSGSWRRSAADPKPLWELHRHQHVVPLAAGAVLGQRDDWARLAVDHLLDWVANNQPGKGPGWISGYETAHRLAGWAFALPLLRSAIEPAEMQHLDTAFVRQCAFVASRPSRYSSANNHRICELVGLLAGARVGALGLEWGQLWQELEGEVDRQTYADGGSREQATGYFLYVLELLWFAGLLAQSLDRPLGRLEERLEAMLDWLATVADDDGEPPAFGDDAEDRILRLRYFQPRRASFVAARVQRLLGREESQQHRESSVLRESGYALFRAGSTRIVFDVGELGFGSLAAHGHADALAVLVDTPGRGALRDSGTGAYAPAGVREPFRATAAHNTVVVDGASQATSLGPHLWGRRYRTTIEAAELSDNYDAVRASHDGYRGTIHRRCVVFAKPDLLVIIDQVLSDRLREATLIWQPCGEVALAVVSSPRAARSDELGPWSPRYGTLAQAPRRTWTARGESVVFATALALAGTFESDEPEAIKLHQERGATVVEVVEPRRVRIVERWRGPAAEVEL